MTWRIKKINLSSLNSIMFYRIAIVVKTGISTELNYLPTNHER